MHDGPCIRLSETKNSNIEVEHVSKESISKNKSASVPKKCIAKFVSKEITGNHGSAPVPKESIGKPTSKESIGGKNKGVPVLKEGVSKIMSDKSASKPILSKDSLTSRKKIYLQLRRAPEVRIRKLPGRMIPGPRIEHNKKEVVMWRHEDGERKHLEVGHRRCCDVTVCTLKLPCMACLMLTTQTINIWIHKKMDVQLLTIGPGAYYV